MKRQNGNGVFKMNELEKEAYDIMKSPEKYEYDIHFTNLHRKDREIYARFDEQSSAGIIFILNEKKELAKTLFIDYSENVEYVRFDIQKSPEIKEMFEELWQEYIKKYNLRIKLAIV
jgi:DNA replicative helicase MCM subunit Mcm2 (Cdc46/Mcm family)